MSNHVKQFYTVAGKPILKPKLFQGTNGTYEQLAQEGIESVPLLEKVLTTALGRYKCKYEIGPPKTEARYKVKAAERGYDSPSENTDYCRAFLYVTSVDQIVKLANFFRPCNNSSVLLFEDTFAVPKISTDLRRIQIKIRLPNGHVAEIQIRHAKMKQAFEESHEAYEKVAAAMKRFPDNTSRPPEAQRIIDHWEQKRYDANHNAALRLPSLQKLIHERDFYMVGKIPVMLVNEPFTGERYAVVPRVTENGPMYVKDNSFIPELRNKKIAKKSDRDTFIAVSTRIAKEALGQPVLEVA